MDAASRTAEGGVRMIKYTTDYILKMDETVRCQDCGKQMRRGQRAVGFREIICVECAKRRRGDNG